MPRKGHTSEKSQRIIALAKAGASIADIQRELGVTYQSAYYTLKLRCLLNVLKWGTSKFDWPSIQRYYDEGHPFRECVEHCGVSMATLIKASKDGKLKTRGTSEAMLLGYRLGTIKPVVITAKHKATLSRCARERGWGGDKPTQKYTYKGFRLCSSYELRVAQALDRAGIEWIKPKTRFRWDDTTGKWHNYSPDLYLPALHIYLDPKNSYCITRDTDKIARVCKQNAVDVRIVPVETIQRWEANPSTIVIDLAPILAAIA